MSFVGNGESKQMQAVPAYGASTFMAAGVTLTITTKSRGLEMFRSHFLRRSGM